MAAKNEEMALAPRQRHFELLTKKQGELMTWCAGPVRPPALIKYAMLSIEQDDKLALCTPISVYMAVLACAATGLLPGKLHDEAHLVPRSRNIARRNDPPRWISEAQFMVTFKGKERLAERAGIMICSGDVCEQDDFEYREGTDPFVNHRKALRERGELIAAYAWCDQKVGASVARRLEIVSLDDIERARKFAGDTPAWRDWKGEMARKLAIHRLSKHLPRTAPWNAADVLDVDTIRDGSLVPVLDALAPEGARLPSKDVEDASFTEAVFDAPPTPPPPPTPPTPPPPPPKETSGKSPSRRSSSAGPAAPEASARGSAGSSSSAPRETAATTQSTTAAASSPPASEAGPEEEDLEDPEREPEEAGLSALEVVHLQFETWARGLVERGRESTPPVDEYEAILRDLKAATTTRTDYAAGLAPIVKWLQGRTLPKPVLDELHRASGRVWKTVLDERPIEQPPRGA